ncbi:MAG: sigma-54-dependent Fis family transcriptional regulator [Flavobacteriales bacterium]|jgi:transcriptional regulator with PAS, ATPase and Fis domain|nr:sigma-54-dependent Fis family transcriptional regulator [Flavobacteriales bacterium]
MDIKQSKQRFGIVGSCPKLNRAINVALQVANTDISVLINGESGTGKETIPQIIHQNSKRKHNNYIAVNCGAIPEGTIDSELFGHEKGSFTGANESRKGYFESADNGTIFLDEIAELPLSSQARLLRVLENGEFIKVGSSKTNKTNVRILAASNVNMLDRVRKGKFREDLYYRLNTISIQLPALRDRGEDIHLLFRKFASDFADKYNTQPIKLNHEAIQIINNYNWPGNIRQLKNFVAQISIIEKERDINAHTLESHLPEKTSNTPIVFKDEKSEDLSEREILYKVLFDMKNDLTELKKITYNIIKESQTSVIENTNSSIFNDIKEDQSTQIFKTEQTIEIEETLSLIQQEKKLIIKALEKHKDRRKDAAKELGISERTLYRKIKDFEL